jgi:hypothetical protein
MSKAEKLAKLTSDCSGIWTPFGQCEPEIMMISTEKDDPIWRDFFGAKVYHSDKDERDTKDGLYVGGMCHTLSLLYLASRTPALGRRQGLFQLDQAQREDQPGGP